MTDPIRSDMFAELNDWFASPEGKAWTEAKTSARTEYLRTGKCPWGPHRGPQGPNEDLSQCSVCWSPSHALRPPGETYGEHLEDCSLPVDHENYCVGGGDGHPESEKVRGYFPPRSWHAKA